MIVILGNSAPRPLNDLDSLYRQEMASTALARGLRPNFLFVFGLGASNPKMKGGERKKRKDFREKRKVENFPPILAKP
jgi:hypothetical protein